MRVTSKAAICLGLAAASLICTAPLAQATQIGEILTCYACQGTGNAAIDNALASNPDVASDGILFAFVNTSASPITGGAFSVSNATHDDSFSLPTIATNSTFILIPGHSNDGAVHPAGGLFVFTGAAMDTSDGAGGLSDHSIFSFTGSNGGLPVASLTFGTSTAIPGTFTPADPGLFLPYRNPPNGSLVSFVGDGPAGDGGCSNCYFGEVATLNTPSGPPVPEPAGAALFMAATALLGFVHRRRNRP